METINVELIVNQLTEIATQYGPKLVGAIVILILGLWIIKGLTKGFVRLLDKSKTDESLKPFLRGLVSILLKVLLVISVLAMIGIEMTSFIAILGAAGLAVGLALSGTLQNFAGGVMVLIFKPFRKGDFVEAQGYSGTVSEIQIFNTILKTPDNKTVILPNGGLSTSSITNYSTEKLRRVDLTFGIGYGDSIEHAKNVLHKIIQEDERILQEPAAPFVEVSELADSSVNFAVRLWVESVNYWPVFFSMNEKVYNEFGTEKINIPYPQMDVHVINEKS
jgi:small conductance mechanosensitive channel